MKSVTRLANATAAAAVSRPRAQRSARPAAAAAERSNVVVDDDKTGGQVHPRRRPDWRYLPDWRQQSLSIKHSLLRRSSVSPDGDNERRKDDGEKDGEWRPRKKLSPAAQTGIRSLFHADRARYTVAHLAERFAVSPDAVRRIVKSTWVPTPAEAAKKEARWRKRADERRASFARGARHERGTKER